VTAAVTLSGNSGVDHRVRTLFFGSSGGSADDIGRAFCCGGTLGALVSDANGTKYILSNNHVLGRSDQAVDGEDATQPGLIDNSCRPATIVGDFAVAPPLGSNVDAALSALRPGMMDESGFILDIGIPSSATVAPVLGLPVAKSGRTTGLTTGSVGAVDAEISVQYQVGCNMGRRFIVNYTGQMIVNAPAFSAGGDSGSLIVTNDSDHQPVALLYAGSSNTTIANPIDEVLAELSAARGSSVSFNLSGSRGSGRGR
jgi:hypothetical protein